MGVFSKLAFWKKRDDELDFDKIAQKELGTGLDRGLEKDPFKQEPLEQSAFTKPTDLPNHLDSPDLTLQQNDVTESRELELISSKLDTVKAILTSMEQRIANLERAAGVEQKHKLW